MLNAELSRTYRLIFILNIQLIGIGFIFSYLNLYLNFWIESYILLIGTFICIGNLLLLKTKRCIYFCGYNTNVLCFIMAVIGNFLLGGITSTYVEWFLVIPIISAATIGLRGLIIFSVLSFNSIALFITIQIPPFYVVPPNHLALVNGVNHIFIFCLIFTVMYHMLTEYKRYELLLKDQNYLLHADKQKFHYLSVHDPLTNLPNRSYFHNYLQKTLEGLNTEKESVTLYFMDLNGFKKINDLYGHEVGDAILFQVGKRLKTCFRGKDLIARMGGDEFTAIIIHKPKGDLIEKLIGRIESDFTNPFLINDIKIPCSISIGTANYPNDTRNAESLLKIADQAMYANKKLQYALGRQDL